MEVGILIHIPWSPWMVPYKMDFKKSFAKAKGRAADTKSAFKKKSVVQNKELLLS